MSNERGRIEKTHNPAEAIAMAKCWLNGWARSGYSLIGNPDGFHPAKCSYCEMPRDFLIQALVEFKDWSKISDDIEEGAPLRMEIEQWLMMPNEEQVRLVRKAQHLDLEVPAVVAEKVNDWWNQKE